MIQSSSPLQPGLSLGFLLQGLELGNKGKLSFNLIWFYFTFKPEALKTAHRNLPKLHHSSSVHLRLTNTKAAKCQTQILCIHLK